MTIERRRICPSMACDEGALPLQFCHNSVMQVSVKVSLTTRDLQLKAGGTFTDIQIIPSTFRNDPHVPGSVESNVRRIDWVLSAVAKCQVPSTKGAGGYPDEAFKPQSVGF